MSLRLGMKWVFFFLSGVSLWAGEKPALPRAEAIFTATPPVVDGVIDPAEWKAAPPVYFPAEAKEESLKNSSEARFLWTAEGLYVALRTTDATPIFGNFKPGEPIYQEDTFEVFLDHFGDHRQYYEVQVNPAGQLFFKNYVLTAAPRLTKQGRLTPEFGESDLWRYDLPEPPGFRVASKLDEQTHAWTVEMFMPSAFVNRRHGGGKTMEPCTMRLNLVRHDWTQAMDVAGRTPAFLYWAPVLPGHPHLSPEAMGYLELKKP